MASLLHCPGKPFSPSLPPPPSSLPKLPFSLSKPKFRPSRFSASRTQFPPTQSLYLSKYRPLQTPFPFDDTESLIYGFHDLLRVSVRYGDVGLARVVHASILKLEEDPNLGNSLIVAYLKLGLAADAYKVFVSLDSPNVVSYTALVSGLAKLNREVEAVRIFCKMRNSGIEPNEFSFVAILTACIRLSELHLGFQIHAMAAKMGYLNCTFVSNALMGLYCKCGCLELVLEVFDKMPQRDIASWNTVISSAVKELMFPRAFQLFRDMQRMDNLEVDYFTISALLTAATESFSLREGREIHAHALRVGLESSLSVNNSLIAFYSRCGSLDDVVALFERMPLKDVISWTEMITAYMEFGAVDLAMQTFDEMPIRNCVSYNALLAGLCQNGQGSRAMTLFLNMLEDGVELTDFTLTSVVKACGLLMEARISNQIHGFILKVGFGSNACIEAALLDMCVTCGRMADAEKMFQHWPFNQDGSMILSSLVGGYARHGQPEKAISLLCSRLSEGTMEDIDEVVSTMVLSICGTLGFHEMGEQVHCHALKAGFLSDLVLGNALMSMYAKCGNMDSAVDVFESMPSHDTVSWSSLIAGHILHRQGDEALGVWSKMAEALVKPDAFTFALIISAYRYTESNIVDECYKLFESLKTGYDIEPTSDHYVSLVSVLGFWGSFEEAEEVISNMPFKPNASVWRALLDSCRLRLNTDLGKLAAKSILGMEPHDPATLILQSNLYSASGRWHCSERVREDMREKGFKKIPGRSWIVLQNTVHSFHSRDKSHPQCKDIHSGLDILVLECLKAGYVPDTSFVLHEVEEHQKKDFLFYHSAKLAVTYGLLMTRRGRPVRVVKTIRVCGDCHTFLKYVSVVTRRQICLRDASGFHVFTNGQCLCKDYW